MEKIFEQIRREVDKHEFLFGKQDHVSGEIYVDNSSIPMPRGVNDEDPPENWYSIFLQPFRQSLYCKSDYDRRAELIKMSAVLANWIDCLDRNGWCVAPPLLNEKFDGETFMPFGKYKGDKLKVVPAQYLLDALENNFVDGLLKDYIIENKTLLLAVIDTGYDCINNKLI